MTNNIIRPTLDLKCGGEHEVEMQPHTTLKEYFGMYSISGKAYRTYGGPNKFFREIARILMEYAFAHTNPTSMPQNKAAIKTARRIKTAQKKAEQATELWQASEQKLVLLEQQHQDHQPLSLPAPSNDAPPAPP